MAASDSTPTPTPVDPDILASARVDGCPNCVENVEPPFDAYPTTDGYIASYHCADCGHRWSTAWKER